MLQFTEANYKRAGVRSVEVHQELLSVILSASAVH